MREFLSWNDVKPYSFSLYMLLNALYHGSFYLLEAGLEGHWGSILWCGIYCGFGIMPFIHIGNLQFGLPSETIVPSSPMLKSRLLPVSQKGWFTDILENFEVAETQHYDFGERESSESCHVFIQSSVTFLTYFFWVYGRKLWIFSHLG